MRHYALALGLWITSLGLSGFEPRWTVYLAGFVSALGWVAWWRAKPNTGREP